MRLFFAVPMSLEVRESVHAAIRDFPEPNPPWRWIPQENFHITLKFLGEVEDGAVQAVRDAAERAAVRSAPFRIAFGNFGGFPSLARPRVIFFAVSEGADRLGDLAALVDRETEKAGFANERRPFRAHLTLARIKQRLRPELRAALEAVPPLPESVAQAVDRFVLMRSHLGREGARYEEIGTYSLGVTL